MPPEDSVARYGSKFCADSEDLNFELPQAPTEKFCQYLYEKFDLASILNERNRVRQDRQFDQKQLVETFSKLSSIFGLSQRVQEQCFAQFAIVVRTTPLHQNIHPIFLALLIALKAADQSLYHSFRLGQVDYVNV
jgi:hypothetical protein